MAFSIPGQNVEIFSVVGRYVSKKDNSIVVYQDLHFQIRFSHSFCHQNGFR